MAWIGAAIGAGASILGGMSGNKKSSREALLDRRFQERMSSTAHQREVADLRKAGLNPILSATGGKGSSTPGGSTAQQRNPVPDNIASTALAVKMQHAQIENIKQDTQKKNSESALLSTKYNESLMNYDLLQQQYQTNAFNSTWENAKLNLFNKTGKGMQQSALDAQNWIDKQIQERTNRASARETLPADLPSNQPSVKRPRKTKSLSKSYNSKRKTKQ